MAILRVRDNDGNIVEIPAIKGDKGDKGEKGDKGVPGAGMLIGSYVGSGGIQRINFDCAVSAVLILTQSYEKGVSNDGFLIRGGFVTYELRDGSYQLAYLGCPTATASYLEVKNVTYNAGTADEYYNGFNMYGTTYHYIAFVEEGVT